MSGDAQISGRIRIEPPITWPELADRQWAVDGEWKPDPPYWADAKVDVSHRDVNTDQGVLSVRLGVGIVPVGGETSGYTLTASVERIVREFGAAPGRGWCRVSDLLAALRRELHELECLAAESRAEGLTAMAVLHEEDAAVVRARIATLESAGGLALGAAADGRWAA